MTTLAPQAPAVRATGWLSLGGRPTAHLWPMLAGSRARRPPAKEFDVLGEAVTGWFARRSARRLDWDRANAIVKAAKSLGSYSEAALDEEVRDARGAAMLDREGREAIDRAFAVGYEAVRREVGLSLHVEQILGALALANGCCAELATGEGKTVTAVLPAALDAWLGRGLHVITVNDYLARRDAEITSPAYRRLGLSVGVIQEGTSREGRQRAYAADITYGADKQIIFDHLRDRLAAPLAPRLSGLLLNEIVGDVEKHAWGGNVVQRGLFAAIVDEADSVLIDDSVTPAIISSTGSDAAGQAHLVLAAELARQMIEAEHYTVDTRLRKVKLTDAGRERLAELSQRLPSFWSGPRRREELMVQSLYAKELYKRGEDYVVKGDAVLIVDRSTGRILPGRQWQLGVHQAVEAKEGLKLTAENVAVARSSYQVFFQKYKRLSGMTGTAREVAREMWAWYRLPVVQVPTHKPVIRTKAPDRVLVDEDDKLDAAVDRVMEAHGRNQPVLVGTWSVVTSERVGMMLRARGVECEVLNATRESEEAAIVERAGMPGAITVATNMAGRGTDIRLSEESRAAGGLLVIATERNDESRVDRQLAGRSGRQGDPGAVEQFVCLEDRLIQQHGTRVLVELVRRNRGPTRRWAARLLWAFAQQTASQRWAALRSEAAKSEAWFEMALHNVSR